MLVTKIKTCTFKNTQHKPSFGASWDLYITKMVMDAQKCKDKAVLDRLSADISILRSTCPTCILCKHDNSDIVSLEEKDIGTRGFQLKSYPICRISKKLDPLTCAKNVHKRAKVLIG